MIIDVIRGGILTTIQDRGRYGWSHLGIPVAGYLDDYAARWANWMLGNPDDAAVIEVTVKGPELVVPQGGTMALSGADLGALVNGQPWPPGTVRHLRAGDRIRFGARKSGARAYLAVPNGILAETVFGSQATDLMNHVGGVGGRALRAGDRLRAKAHQPRLRRAAPIPTCLSGAILRIVPGVHLSRFPPDTWNQLIVNRFRVSPESSAVGVRLAGPPMASASAEGLSEGTAMGTVQCLPNGQLVALLKHRGTIGGYPAVAHVIRADWARLAQLVPGDWVQFEAVSYDQAISGWQQQQQWFVKPPVTRALRVTAAASGVVRELDRYGRPFVPVGAFVYPGQALAALDGDEGRVTVFSPGYGLVAERARTGEALRVGDTVAIIHEGWVDGED